MRINNAALLALMLFMTAILADATENNDTVPQFAYFPAIVVHTENPASIMLATENEQLFRTRLRHAIKQPVNFAGEYVLTTWGCGTSCIAGAVVSRKTGQVTFLPGTICCWKGQGERLYFRVNSRLLVTAGLMNEGGEHGAHFYEFSGERFRHIKTLPLKRDEPDI